MAEKTKDDLDGNSADTAAAKAALKKKLLLAGGFVLLIVISVIATVVLYRVMSDTPPPDGPVEAAAVLVEPGDDEDQAALRALVERQAEAIARLEEEMATLRLASTPSHLQDILVSQERSFQQFLTALKEGMNDMANMVRGSRTWLELYESRINEVIAESEGRIERLKQWGTGAPADQTTSPAPE